MLFSHFSAFRCLLSPPFVRRRCCRDTAFLIIVHRLSPRLCCRERRPNRRAQSSRSSSSSTSPPPQPPRRQPAPSLTHGAPSRFPHPARPPRLLLRFRSLFLTSSSPTASRGWVSFGLMGARFLLLCSTSPRHLLSRCLLLRSRSLLVTSSFSPPFLFCPPLPLLSPPDRRSRLGTFLF